LILFADKDKQISRQSR